MKPFGLGSADFQIAVYIGNRPNMPAYQQFNSILPLQPTEVASIGQECGNGWRKVFNVYAKFLLALNPPWLRMSKTITTWQQYRDELLLQESSETALLFSPPQLDAPNEAGISCDSDVLHIICGKTYANDLINNQHLNVQLNWFDHEFAIDKEERLIVCPYFDYRQLSNIKIDRLCQIINKLNNNS